MLTDEQRAEAYYKLKKYMNEMIDSGILAFFSIIGIIVGFVVEGLKPLAYICIATLIISVIGFIIFLIKYKTYSPTK